MQKRIKIDVWDHDTEKIVATHEDILDGATASIWMVPFQHIRDGMVNVTVDDGTEGVVHSLADEIRHDV